VSSEFKKRKGNNSREKGGLTSFLAKKKGRKITVPPSKGRQEGKTRGKEGGGDRTMKGGKRVLKGKITLTSIAAR